MQASLDEGFNAMVLDANVGAGTTLDATGVPGTFYVRIVGRSACGAGDPSAIVAVTLP